MEGSFLRLYVHERDRHGGKLLWEWLLERANAMGVQGGTAFRAIAGFGRHHVLHETRFIELAGDTPVQVEFIVTEDEADRLLDLLTRERIRVFYARIPARFGTSSSA